MSKPSPTSASGALPELPKTYAPADIEPAVLKRWSDADAFHAESTDPGQPYAIVIPPPNVTAALHLGHALNNTLQDILIRWRRMCGDNAMWMPGTDHAGIATQTVVDKRLQSEGKPALKEHKRMEAAGQGGREKFIEQVQAWKDEYEATITNQLKTMGCSCDWSRQRFTMDEICARAVREAFFQLFKDGLIYRGKRLVNWDPATQTALADDEVEMQEIDGHFWYLKYPVVDDAGRDTSQFVTVATTRPETMLGDTAVAMNPADPRAAALVGRRVRLPIVNRIIPIIADEYVVLPDENSDDAKAKFASGFLKVTPAHDPNDYDIGQRHNLPVINVMAPDATISKDHGWPADDFARADADAVPLNLDRYEAREAIVDWFRANDLLAEVRPYRHSVGHSYRSHVPVEPYLSDQWYVAVTKQIPHLPDVGRWRDTSVPLNSLAGLALQAMADDAASDRTVPTLNGGTACRGGTAVPPSEGVAPSDASWQGRLRFIPERYAKTFQIWHENIRDWCISRQLWWGHRIPVWHVTLDYRSVNPQSLDAIRQERLEFRRKLEAAIDAYATACRVPNGIAMRVDLDYMTCFICARNAEAEGALQLLERFIAAFEMKQIGPGGSYDYLKEPDWGCDAARHAAYDLHALILTIHQDPDVLDTWFSSGLWPLSTMGWPAVEGNEVLATWNPTSVLSTAREIITLWVSRMVMFNLYFHGRLPFKDVFIHAMIQDGDGRKMSKSLGNGVDPLDIIHSHGSDAMRFTLAQMTTQTQDVRMPVERDAATGRNTSPKFDLGRNFANKLWNAVRFALGHLGGCLSEDTREEPTLADRWILSRLARTLNQVNAALESYQFNVYTQSLYDFAWRDLCDWYLEAIKPVVRENSPRGAAARQTLGVCLDALLRMLHPVMPFLTEALWSHLNALCPQRSTSGVELDPSELCIKAPWPKIASALVDDGIEQQFTLMQQVVTGIREVRTTYKVPPRQKVALSAKAPAAIAQQLLAQRILIEALANVEPHEVGPQAGKPADAAAAVVGEIELYLHGLIDTDAERQRLAKRLEEIDASIRTLAGRLGNASYAERAPAHLVQQTRDQLAAAQREKQAIEQQLAAVG